MKKKRYSGIRNLAAVDPKIKKLLSALEDEKPTVHESGEDYSEEDEEFEDNEEEGNEFFMDL